MSTLIKRLIAGAVGLIILGLIVYAFLPKPVPVDIEPVTTGPMRVTVDEEGITRIQERYVVAAPLAGWLLRIGWEPGDRVTAGDSLLARIEPRPPELLDPRTRAEVEARVEAARASVQQAERRLERARAEHEQKQNDYERYLSLRQRGAVSQKELDDAALAARIAAEEYRAARFAVDVARFELQQARAALPWIRAGTAEASPSDGRADNEASRAKSAGDEHFEIRAPVDGQILRVQQESATAVSPGTALLEIGDLGNLEIVVDVLSADAVKIEPGDEVIIEDWGGDRPLTGVVQRVEPAAFTEISALGVEEQRVNVIVELAKADERRTSLGDGYRVEARIIIWQADDVLRVPTSALFRQGEDWAVFRVIEGRAQLQPIKVGRQNGLIAQVLEGLEAGDRVIAHPGDQISDGIRVEPRD